MKFNNTILGSLALATLFSGCSSYKLQDYADEYFNQKPTSTSQSSSKSIQTSSSSNEYDDVWREFDEVSPQKSSAPVVEKESVMDASHQAVIGASAANYDNTHNALQTISPTPTYNENKREGFLQATYNDFVEEEWSPNVEQNEEINEKYGEKDRSFTLQEYVDKWKVYTDTHVTPEWESHVKKVDDMPVIGK